MGMNKCPTPSPRHLRAVRVGEVAVRIVEGLGEDRREVREPAHAAASENKEPCR